MCPLVGDDGTSVRFSEGGVHHHEAMLGITDSEAPAGEPRNRGPDEFDAVGGLLRCAWGCHGPNVAINHGLAIP
jgi:hypothetical protein